MAIVTHEERAILSGCATLPPVTISDEQEKSILDFEESVEKHRESQKINEEIERLNTEVNAHLFGVDEKSGGLLYHHETEKHGGVMMDTDIDYLDQLAENAHRKQGLPKESQTPFHRYRDQDLMPQILFPGPRADGCGCFPRQSQLR